MIAVWDWKSQYTGQDPAEIFDCMIAEFLLSEGRTPPPMETVLMNYGVTALADLMAKQQEKLAATPQLQALFRTVEIPLVEVLWRMEQTGIAFDADCLRAVGQEIDAAVAACEADLRKEFGAEINLNSAAQVGTFLSEKVGVPLARTKTGKYATNEGELSQHAEQFPVIGHLLTYRELTKLRSTYIESLIDKVGADGRIHTTYTQTAASTGRLASSNPNLQNIPVTSGFGQKIKACFVAGKGKLLASFDYSQQELRILAHLTGEEKLISAFRDQQDVHRTTASQIFGVGYGAVTKEQRMIAKTINFGIIYGMSSFGLSAALRIPVEAAQQFIDTFYATYPRIRSYFDEYVRQGKANRYVETLLGRRRNVFEYPNQKFIDNAMRRVLINFPIQGSAADLMRKTMVEIHTHIIKDNPRCALLLQIHDDLVFEMDDDPAFVRQTITDISRRMCGVYALAVPIDVDVKVGNNWGEMNPYTPTA